MPERMDALKVNESFVIQEHERQAAWAARTRNFKSTGKEFTVRLTKGTQEYRVWRTA